ncbi:MAG: transketolase family protein, partial [Peptococcaceae bacterium]|nr:transketolase family protein [Peptococcaceae bacterium]
EAAASHSRLIVTVEEHFVAGGLGSACVEYLSTLRSRPQVGMLGVEDRFGQSGHPDELLDLYGLRASNIVAAVKRSLDS